MSTEMKIIEETKDYTVSIIPEKNLKVFKSAEANYIFDMKRGTMLTWGKTFAEDPVRFPAPNILDAEVTTICRGVNGRVCPFCYKANTPNGRNMSFETFKHIFNVYPKSLTQLAFGADASLTSNPDLWKMMEYCRENYVIPNVTAACIDDETADKIAKYCGAAAISVYDDKDAAYDSIKRLTDRGMTQINIHLMISKETFNRAKTVLEDITKDSRLSKLNAVVFLSLKKKGRGVGFHTLSQEEFNELVTFATSHNINVGFDSCSSLKAYRAFDDESIRQSIIPCEASTQSSYINVDGFYYPCSFCEGEKTNSLDWSEGLNINLCNSTEEFLEKIWNHPKTKSFTEALNNTCCDNPEKCAHCPVYEV